MKRRYAVCTLAACAVIIAIAATPTRAADHPVPAANAAKVARGHYLVTFGGCNDCHTPWKMGEKGPEPDMSRMLSGHPQSLAIQAVVAPPAGPWMAVVGNTFTAWSGPWGVSFTKNLTPDRDTGLGTWTEKEFIATMRTGHERGLGREILPPMPWQNYGKATDADLSAMFAYLKSIPAISNHVPDPIPPVAAPAK
jgi:hypothetical protein